MDTMQAIRAHSRGGPDSLRLERAPVPVPEADEVLIEVHAAAITYDELLWDESWTREGIDRTPIIPSHEVSGTVAELGDRVRDLKIGQDVYGLIEFDRDGAAAQYVTVPAADLAVKPRERRPHPSGRVAVGCPYCLAGTPGPRAAASRGVGARHRRRGGRWGLCRPTRSSLRCARGRHSQDRRSIRLRHGPGRERSIRSGPQPGSSTSPSTRWAAERYPRPTPVCVTAGGWSRSVHRPAPNSVPGETSGTSSSWSVRTAGSLSRSRRSSTMEHSNRWSARPSHSRTPRRPTPIAVAKADRGKPYSSSNDPCRTDPSRARGRWCRGSALLARRTSGVGPTR